MKTNKRKVRTCLKCVKEFLRRFDLENGKYLLIFLGVFAEIIKVAHFAQAINFRERTHGNCTRGQLNNEVGGELHEIKRSLGKNEIGKEII